VLEPQHAAIRPVPDMGVVVDTRFLRGLAAHAGRLVMLLDVEKLLRPEDIQTLDAALPDLQEIEVAAA
jgi:purine-binding chemotaxis protein CheW